MCSLRAKKKRVFDGSKAGGKINVIFFLFLCACVRLDVNSSFNGIFSAAKAVLFFFSFVSVSTCQINISRDVSVSTHMAP